MSGQGPLVLAINPGAGSTKLALYRGAAAGPGGGAPPSLVAEARVEHPELLARPAARVWDERPARLADVRAFLAAQGVQPGTARLAAVAGRGGLLPPVPAGAFLVDAPLLADLEAAARGEHASNLGAPLAAAVAAEHGAVALIVDPVSVDELSPVARVTGLAGVERRSFVHALNLRAVARRHAGAAGRPLEALRLVVAHLGTGISLAAFAGGRMIDVVNPQDEGPFSGDRAGAVPAMALIDLASSPGADPRRLKRALFGDGGLYSHLGTRDAREAVRRAAADDARAALLLDAMAYQVAKAAGGLAAALEGRVDAVLLTGGLCHLPEVVEPVRRRVAFIAPVALHPGEDELLALAEGALAVLSGAAPARTYGGSVLSTDK